MQASYMNTGRPKLDRMDLRILCHLQKNGRAVNAVVADAVGLSPRPCLVRMKRLEQAGYIAGYGAQIRLEKLGDTLLVFTEVTLHNQTREDFERFETCIRLIDEVVECHRVSGPNDYLLKFITRGLSHYQEIMERLLKRDIGIDRYLSYIVTKTPFVKDSYLIERLMQLPAESAPPAQ
jgi:DNA-binding Lrp family transcriptional regulator